MSSTTTTTTMTAAERFFYDRAGYSYGADETEQQGRERGARRLAAAEEWLNAQGGYEVEWMEDADADRSFLPKRDRRPLFGCVVRLPDGRETSLWSIDLGRDGDLSDPYCRVVKAELALELMTD